MLHWLKIMAMLTFLCVVGLCVTWSRPSFSNEQFSTIPTARMAPSGYMGFKIEHLDPFLKVGIGVQVFDPLYIELQHNALISSFSRSRSDRSFPGANIKLRLQEETYSKPAIAIGLNNAIGQSRLSSEYIVASKYFRPFDVSAGVAWGKIGSAAQISNPLKSISSHFGDNRDTNNEDGNGPENWFTGQDIGLFGGISYQTPWKRLQLNADWSADRYEIEQGLISDFNTPNPWSIGATLRTFDHYSIHAAFVGGEKFMFRVNSNQALKDLETRKFIKSTPERMRTGNKSQFTRQYLGLTGHTYRLPERQIYASDLMTSPAEMWHDLEITKAPRPHYFKTNHFFKPKKLRLRLKETIDFTNENDGILSRSAAILDGTTETVFGIFASAGLRVNIHDNISQQSTISSFPPAVRSAEHVFADKTFALDRAYMAKNHSFGDIHTNVTAGYLEEMVAGWGGQVLYRPYQRTYAFGAEAWETYQRDPFSRGNSKFFINEQDWTGHLNGFYELPDTNTTLSAKAGRYLAGDYGVTAEVSHLFKNGVDVSTHMTVTNENNIDIFGGVDHSHAGLTISVPLKVKGLPKKLQKTCCDLDLRFEPLARNTGQILRHPMPLYKISEPLSYRHTVQNWDDIRE